MDKLKIKNTRIFLTIFLSFLIVMLPVCFAEQLNGRDRISTESVTDEDKSSADIVFLPAWLIALIGAEVVKAILIGTAVMIAGYIIYHLGVNSWIYYTANEYSTISSHAYDHRYDFPYELGKKPSKSDFKDFCKNIINGKSKYVKKFSNLIQTGDGKKVVVAVLKKTTSKNGKLAVVIGKTDGKTIETCYPADEDYIIKKITKKVWRAIDGWLTKYNP